MIDASVAMPTRTIAILNSKCLVWLGLQNILERCATVPMIVLPYQRRTPNRLLAECRPDVFILDLENEQDAVSLIKRIRESAPNSKIVLFGGFEEQERMREAFAYGVDGVILSIQPPEVVLASIEALYPPGKHCGQAERHETECGGARKKRSEQKGCFGNTAASLARRRDRARTRGGPIALLGPLQQRDRLSVVDCPEYGAAPSDELFREGRRA